MPSCIRTLLFCAMLALPASALAAGPMLVAQNTPPPGQPVNPSAPGTPVQRQPFPKVQPPTAPIPKTPAQPNAATPPVPKAAPAPKAPRQTHTGRPPATPPGVVPAGPPVVAPPGSVVVPPAAVVPPPGRSTRGRAADVARCNSIQANCANRCNHATYGQARNMCYNQCNAQFVACTNRANVRP